jgi:hypothetical protein
MTWTARLVHGLAMAVALALAAFGLKPTPERVERALAAADPALVQPLHASPAITVARALAAPAPRPIAAAAPAAPRPAPLPVPALLLGSALGPRAP